MNQVVQEMEKQLTSHAEELQSIADQRSMQKELATKYSAKVLELEKEIRLKALSLKETGKELGIEKAVSSKFYDEVNYCVMKQRCSRSHIRLCVLHLYSLT